MTYSFHSKWANPVLNTWRGCAPLNSFHRMASSVIHMYDNILTPNSMLSFVMVKYACRSVSSVYIFLPMMRFIRILYLEWTRERNISYKLTAYIYLCPMSAICRRRDCRAIHRIHRSMNVKKNISAPNAHCATFFASLDETNDCEYDLEEWLLETPLDRPWAGYPARSTCQIQC